MRLQERPLVRAQPAKRIVAPQQPFEHRLSVVRQISFQVRERRDVAQSVDQPAAASCDCVEIARADEGLDVEETFALQPLGEHGRDGDPASDCFVLFEPTETGLRQEQRRIEHEQRSHRIDHAKSGSFEFCESYRIGNLPARPGALGRVCWSCVTSARRFEAQDLLAPLALGVGLLHQDRDHDRLGGERGDAGWDARPGPWS